jgi:hypothetical protein
MACLAPLVSILPLLLLTLGVADEHGMSGATSLYPAPAAAYLGWVADEHGMSGTTSLYPAPAMACLAPLVSILSLLLLTLVG